MNKFFTKIAALSVGLAMAIGVGVAVGSKSRDVARVEAGANDYLLHSGAVVAADYLIVYDGKAMNTTLDKSNRAQFDNVTITNNTITTTTAALIWHIEKAGTIELSDVTYDYYTIYSASKGKYLGSTAKNSVAFLDDASSNTGKWLLDGTYDFINIGRQTSSLNPNNKYLRKNGTYGFGCYASGTGAALSLYKKDSGDPSVTITNANKLAPRGVAMSLTATIANNNDYTVHWSSNVDGVTFSSSTSSSGAAISATVGNGVAVGTVVEITATAKDGSTTLTDASTTLVVSSVNPNSTSNAIFASEAKSIVSTNKANGIENFYVKGYVTGVDSSNKKYLWLDDTASETHTFEIYNNTNNTFSGYAVGDFVVAHGTTSYYQAGDASEITGATADSREYLTLSNSEVQVGVNAQITISASSKSDGTVAWSITSGSSYATILSSTESSATIKGLAKGEATLTATLGNISKTCVITVDDWAFDSLELVAGEGFVDTYYENDSFDNTGLTVNWVEYSASRTEYRRTNVTSDAEFVGFDSSTTGNNKSLTATYNEKTSNAVYYSVIEKPDYDIAFGTPNVKINAASVVDSTSGWTITTTGTTSFTQQPTYSQIGSSSYPATSITFEKTISSVVNLKTFFIDLGGFNGTSATVTLKVNDVTVGTGSLGSSDVTIRNSSYGRGSGSSTSLQIVISNIAKGVKAYGIVIETKTDSEMISGFITDYMHMSHTTNDGSCKTEGWYNAAKAEYNKMSLGLKSAFNSSEDTDVVAAKNRLVKWAIANGETFDPSAGTFTQNSRVVFNGFDSLESNTATIIIVVISLVSLTAVGGYFLLKKKKKQ